MIRRPGRGRRIVAAAALFASALAPVVGAPTIAVAGTAVNGGGSSFQAPEALQWAADTARQPYGLDINYVTSSSGAGRDFYAEGLYDFAATDIVYNLEDGNYEQQAETEHPFKYVTVSAGGLAFQYNLVIGGQRFTGLNLTPAEVCGIFTGEITNWTQLAGTTGDSILASYDEPIEAVVRSDSAGESYVLSQFCLAVEPAEWSKFQTWVDANAETISYSDPNMAVGQPVSLWPGVLINNDRSVDPQSGATAVSEAVANPSTGEGSITYVASAYAKEVGAPVASVENPAGYFVQPDANSVQIALSYARANSLGTFDLNFDGSNKLAYFPSTYSYVVDPSTTKTKDPGINKPLNTYLCYAIGLGQDQAAPLLYAPLSAQVTKLSVDAIEATPDAPPASSCGVGGPSPDVTANGGGIKGNDGTGAGTTTTGKAAAPPVKAASTGSSPGTGTGTSSGSQATGTGTGSSGTTGGSTKPGSRSTGSSDNPAASGGSPGTVAPVQQVAVASGPASPASDPLDDDALWWVLGGVLLAAAVSWASGARHRGRA